MQQDDFISEEDLKTFEGSCHRDGTLHMKGRDFKVLPAQKRQPLTDTFRGTEHLGSHAGHGKASGAVCDPSASTGVVLGPRYGTVTVDLVEPGHEPTSFPWERIAVRQTFKDVAPWVVITVGTVGVSSP